MSLNRVPLIKMYPLSAIASVMAFYLLATGHTGWYFYVILGFIVLERAIVQAILYISQRIALQALARYKEMMEAAAASSPFSGLGVPGGGDLPPMMGGSIEPPE